MENNESKQHVQLPNQLITFEDMQPKDIIVYLAIRLNQGINKQYPKAAVVGTETIAKTLGCSDKTVRNSINLLKKNGAIIVEKLGKCNAYYFPKFEGFEKFSPKKIKNPNLTYKQKAFYAAQQQYMIKNNQNCYTEYNLVEISNRIHLNPKTIKKYENDFKKQGLMVEVTTNKINPETGCAIIRKIYNSKELGQFLWCVAENHEYRLRDIEKQMQNTSDLQEQVELLKQRLDIVEDNNKNLKKLTSLYEKALSKQTVKNIKQEYDRLYL